MKNIPKNKSQVKSLDEALTSDKVVDGILRDIAPKRTPDLLAACKMAFALLEDHQDDAQWYLRKHYNQLVKAIAKAEVTK